MRQIFVAALFIGSLLFNPVQGHAQDRSAAPTVLVIDASNSMWGRIDGRAKMEIAREAVSSLVGTLPKGARLGMVA